MTMVQLALLSWSFHFVTHFTHEKCQKKQAKNQHFRSFIVFLSTISRLLHKILFFISSLFTVVISFLKWLNALDLIYISTLVFLCMFSSAFVSYVIFRCIFFYVYVFVCIWTFVNRVSFERIPIRKWFLVYSSAMDWYTHGTHCIGLFWSFVFMVSLVCVLLHDVFRQIDSISFLVSMFFGCLFVFFFLFLPSVYYNVTSCSIGRIISSFFYLFVI